LPAVPEALQRAADDAAEPILSGLAWLRRENANGFTVNISAAELIKQYIIRHVLAAKVCVEPEHASLCSDQMCYQSITELTAERDTYKARLEQALRLLSDVDGCGFIDWTRIGCVQKHKAAIVAVLHNALDSQAQQG